MPYPPLPTVAIIGRTNVGKSTLFNRLTENYKALVSEIHGTTRDRNYSLCFWRGKKFNLIDTGGLIKTNSSQKKGISTMEEKINQQIHIALKEADLILFIIDGQTPLFPQDKEIASILRKEKKPVLLVINKTDNLEKRESIDPAVFNLGFKNCFLVSAINGSGTGDLLDEIFKRLKIPESSFLPEEKDWIKISIIGKPNVGKSSLLNAILGEEKVIVSETPHTTRAPQDTLINYQDRPILLIDTAGIRRKAKINDSLEKGGVKLSLKALKESQIILLVIEAHQTINNQDKKLAQLIIKANKSVALIANKYDLIPLKEQNDYKKNILKSLSFLNFTPALFVSAKTGLNVEKILPLILEIKKQRDKKIEQRLLDNIINEVRFPKPKRKKIAKIYQLVHKDINPPYFVLTVNRKDLLPSAFLDILKKRLREEFTFLGTPIIISVRAFKK